MHSTQASHTYFIWFVNSVALNLQKKLFRPPRSEKFFFFGFLKFHTIFSATQTNNSLQNAAKISWRPEFGPTNRVSSFELSSILFAMSFRKSTFQGKVDYGCQKKLFLKYGERPLKELKFCAYANMFACVVVFLCRPNVCILFIPSQTVISVSRSRYAPPSL